jgi:hypothetical protein
MKSSNVEVHLLCAFFVGTLGIAFYFNRNFPILVVAPESSVGTWVSGVLLSCCAAILLVLSMHRGWYPWALIGAFFLLLAADEHFMFHERMKEWIMFSFPNQPVIVRESPALAGAIVGGLVSWILWIRLQKFSRLFLAAAVLLGASSVSLDVIGDSALWEECLKLLAELTITCALLFEAKSLSLQYRN